MKRVILILVVMSMLLVACGQGQAPAAATTTAAAAVTTAATTAASAATTAAQAQTSSTSDKYGGILHTTVVSTDSLNPCLAIARMSTWSKMHLIYDQLITKDVATDEYIPMLATDWSISDDGLTYTFNLRDDVVFHNGEKMNAETVKKSWEFFKDAEVNAAGYPADELTCVESITVLSEYSIEMKLSETSGLLLSAFCDLSGCVIAPKAIDNYLVSQDQFDIAAGGSGPFIIDPAQTILDQKYVYKRNPNYWMKDADGNQLPYLDGLEQTVSSDESVNFANLQSGDFDYISIGDMTSINKAMSMDTITAQATGSVLNLRNYYNSAKPPFDDVKVREALDWAVDGLAIQEVMAGEYGFQLPWIVTEKQSYYVPADEWLNRYDPEKAKQMLAEAGYPNGFESVVYVGSGSQVKIAELVVEQLEKVGVKCKIEAQDTTAIKALWNVTNPDTPSGMLVINTNIPRIDPWAQYNNDFGPVSSTNFGKCLDDDFQALLLKVKQEPNQEKRMALLTELQDIALNYHYLKLLYNIDVYNAYTNKLQDVKFDFRGMPYWTYINFIE